MIKLILALILSLPEMLKLYRELEKKYEEHEKKKLLEKDIEEIREAFRTRDASRLGRVFDKTNRSDKA